MDKDSADVKMLVNEQFLILVNQFVLERGCKMIIAVDLQKIRIKQILCVLLNG